GGSRNFRVDAFTSIQAPQAASGYELVLYPTIQLGDGSQSNNSWLHEMPDPVTKIVWDNYVSISVGTAEKLKLKEGTVVKLTVNGVTQEYPTHIQPGLHDDVFAIAVGYGRTRAGKVANGVGVNAYELVNFSNNQAVYSGQAVTAVATKAHIQLAN